MAIDLKPARNALRKAVDDLKKVGKADLDQLKNPGTGTQFSSGSAWVEGLAIAVRELEVWCDPNSPDNDKFGLDVKPQR